MATRTTLKHTTQDVEASLHTKYRPKTLKDVVGQDAVVQSIASAFKAASRAHTFLLTGSAGVGKTTIARILASMCEVAPDNLLEVDAATNTGIDDMRSLTDTLRYTGFGPSQNKFVIIDECHALSAAAWKSLLKITEEPPKHVYFALCTTEIEKVPATIRSRALCYALREVSKDDLWDILEKVVEEEEYNTPEDVCQLIVKAAEGSVRRMLTCLAAVYDCKDVKEASTILAQPYESEQVIELCRDLVADKLTWEKVTRVLTDLKDDDPESLRLVIVNYLNAVLLKASTSKAPLLLETLVQFSKPCNRSEKVAPLLIAFGNSIRWPK